MKQNKELTQMHSGFDGQYVEPGHSASGVDRQTFIFWGTAHGVLLSMSQKNGQCAVFPPLNFATPVCRGSSAIRPVPR
jgi:hypothetical protein